MGESCPRCDFCSMNYQQLNKQFAKPKKLKKLAVQYFCLWRSGSLAHPVSPEICIEKVYFLHCQTFRKRTFFVFDVWHLSSCIVVYFLNHRTMVNLYFSCSIFFSEILWISEQIQKYSDSCLKGKLGQRMFRQFNGLTC